MTNNELHSRIIQLEKKAVINRRYYIMSIVILLSAFIGLSFKQSEHFNIIRAKGIIIEDSLGRDRILIGSPIPFSKDRVRTDSLLVRKHWSNELGASPEHYMKLYKSYYHGTEGIVIMNEDGFDRILLGDKLADSNVGTRMFEAAGITWNDQRGFELGGAGVNTDADGNARGVVGLDNPNGEAIHMVALEDGTNALIIGGTNGTMIIGLSKKGGMLASGEKAFLGIKYMNNQGKIVWEQAIE